MTVWGDSDDSWSKTELSPNQLPKWDSITEYLKLFIGFDVGIEFGVGYSFTALIEPIRVSRWKQSRIGFMKSVERNIRRQLNRRGLKGIPFAYVAETRSKDGKTRVPPHLHGYAICEAAGTQLAFEEALQRALFPSVKKGKRKAIIIEPSYDHRGKEFEGRAFWIDYFTKNIAHWDELLGRRRLFISQSLTRISKAAWLARREE